MHCEVRAEEDWAATLCCRQSFLMPAARCVGEGEREGGRGEGVEGKSGEPDHSRVSGLWSV